MTETQKITTPQAYIDFDIPPEAEQISIIGQNVRNDVTGHFLLRASVDGTAYKSGASDYVSYPTGGTMSGIILFANSAPNANAPGFPVSFSAMLSLGTDQLLRATVLGSACGPSMVSGSDVWQRQDFSGRALFAGRVKKIRILCSGLFLSGSFTLASA